VSDARAVGPPVPVLEVRGLRIEIPTRRSSLVPVDDVSFHVAAGETLGLVGESGAGKSLTASAVIGLIDPPGHVAAGEILLEGRRIDGLPHQAMRRLRGRRVAAVFQDPVTSLDPLFTVGDQLVETIRTHLHVSADEASRRAEALLDEVGIRPARERLGHYPHQLSGGMRQRVAIALALCAEPALLVADEPTTALDVSLQAQIVELLRRLSRERGVSVLLITHDLGVVAESCDRVVVMYAGRVPALDRTGERLEQIEGAMPGPGAIPAGCAFHPRCRRAVDRCRSERPPLVAAGAARVACWLVPGPDEVTP
jgi:peptide/nickel transport system ATP-binding protein